MPRSSRPPKTPKTAKSPKAASGSGEPPRRPSVEVRVKPGERPGSEVHEIEYESEPPAPPKKAPAKDPYPEHESTKQGLGLAEQVRQTMPTLPPPKTGRTGGLKRQDTQDFDKPSSPPKHGAVEAHLPQAWAGDPDDEPSPLRSTNAGLGIPSPGLGRDTDFDPLAMAPPTRKLGTPSTDIDLGLVIKGEAEDAPDSHDALDLVSRNPASSIVPPEPTGKADPLGELRERYALGDFSGALAIAEDILTGEPDNVDAQRYAESCRDVLRQMYAARLGPMDQVPVVAIPTEQLRWLTLDHRSGFLLSHVDGVSTLEEILDVSGMNPLEAMRIIYDLLQQKVIALQ